jgi:hypothetical protein
MKEEGSQPLPEPDPKARRALFWIYLAMGTGILLPPVLFYLFGITHG